MTEKDKLDADSARVLEILSGALVAPGDPDIELVRILAEMPPNASEAEDLAGILQRLAHRADPNQG